MSDHLSLADRCEQGETSSILDEQIWSVMNDKPITDKLYAPYITRATDCALIYMRDGWSINICIPANPKNKTIAVVTDCNGEGEPPESSGQASSAPLAIIAAILRAEHTAVIDRV